MGTHSQKKGKHTGKPASLEKKWGKEFKNILEKKASILDVWRWLDVTMYRIICLNKDVSQADSGFLGASINYIRGYWLKSRNARIFFSNSYMRIFDPLSPMQDFLDPLTLRNSWKLPFYVIFFASLKEIWTTGGVRLTSSQWNWRA